MARLPCACIRLSCCIVGDGRVVGDGRTVGDGRIVGCGTHCRPAPHSWAWNGAARTRGAEPAIVDLPPALKRPALPKSQMEADRIGLMLMSRACFDPEAMERIFKRLGSYERKMMKGGKVGIHCL